MRSFWFFYTAGLTASANISAAVLSLCGTTSSNTFTVNTFTVNIFNTSSSSTTAIAVDDYQTAGATAYCDTSIAYSSWSNSDYNDFALNAAGVAAISKTGLTRFCGREANYDAANSSPTWEAGKAVYFNAFFADDTSGTKDPKLVITYTLGTTFLPEVRII